MPHPQRSARARDFEDLKVVSGIVNAGHAKSEQAIIYNPFDIIRRQLRLLQNSLLTSFILSPRIRALAVAVEFGLSRIAM